jgi:hypothetical protein
VPERGAHLTFAQELLSLVDVVAIAFAKRFDGDDLARLAVHRPVDAGEAAGADHVLDFVIAVVIAGALAAEDAVDLIVGHELFAQDHAAELVEGDVVGAELTPNRL